MSAGGVVWLAAALLLVSLLCGVEEADGEVDDAGALELMLLAEAEVVSLGWAEDALGLDGAALAALEPAAVVSLLVEGVAAVLAALLAELAELISLVLLGLLI